MKKKYVAWQGELFEDIFVLSGTWLLICCLPIGATGWNNSRFERKEVFERKAGLVLDYYWKQMIWLERLKNWQRIILFSHRANFLFFTAVDLFLVFARVRVGRHFVEISTSYFFNVAHDVLSVYSLRSCFFNLDAFDSVFLNGEPWPKSTVRMVDSW